MRKLIDQLRSGVQPSPSSLLDALAIHFPLINELKNTPQDEEWHREGDVRVHTEMVIAEVYQLLNKEKTDLCPDQVVCLVLGAALHDIGKALTTKSVEIAGKTRIVSPHHPERGGSYVAPLISGLGLSKPEIETILGLIWHHHDLRKLVVRNSEARHYTRLARAVDLQLLYWLEICDIRGRICSDPESQIEIFELFREEAENFGLWQKSDPYEEWKFFLAGEIKDPKEFKYAYQQGVYDYENGRINSPSEALARSFQHRQHHGSLTIISAPSGCGKSTWIREHIGDEDETVLISLDDLRFELNGKRSEQSKNGQVLQLGKERLRQALREKKDIVWDSTALRSDHRVMLVGLAHDYHASSHIVALGVCKDIAMKRNKKRTDQIPSAVVEKQYCQWQWPTIWEAHEVIHCFG